MERHARLKLTIDPGDAIDGEEVAELTEQLRRELLDLDVLSVEPAGGGQARPAARAWTCRPQAAWSSG